MGHRINPISLRLKTFRSWSSLWYGSIDYSNLLVKDLSTRALVSNLNRRMDTSMSIPFIKIFPTGMAMLYTEGHSLKLGGHNKTARDRSREKLRSSVLSISTSFSAPALFLRKSLTHEVTSRTSKYFLKFPISNAQLVATYIAFELQKKNPFSEPRRDVIDWGSVTTGIQGIYIICTGKFRKAGRIVKQKYIRGKMPFTSMSTLIDYGESTAKIKHGTIGIKVWINFSTKKE